MFKPFGCFYFVYVLLCLLSGFLILEKLLIKQFQVFQDFREFIPYKQFTLPQSIKEADIVLTKKPYNTPVQNPYSPSRVINQRQKKRRSMDLLSLFHGLVNPTQASNKMKGTDASMTLTLFPGLPSRFTRQLEETVNDIRQLQLQRAPRFGEYYVGVTDLSQTRTQNPPTERTNSHILTTNTSQDISSTSRSDSSSYPSKPSVLQYEASPLSIGSIKHASRVSGRIRSPTVRNSSLSGFPNTNSRYESRTGPSRRPPVPPKNDFEDRFIPLNQTGSLGKRNINPSSGPSPKWTVSTPASQQSLSRVSEKKSSLSNNLLEATSMRTPPTASVSQQHPTRNSSSLVVSSTHPIEVMHHGEKNITTDSSKPSASTISKRVFSPKLEIKDDLFKEFSSAMTKNFETFLKNIFNSFSSGKMDTLVLNSQQGLLEDQVNTRSNEKVLKNNKTFSENHSKPFLDEPQLSFPPLLVKQEKLNNGTKEVSSPEISRSPPQYSEGHPLLDAKGHTFMTPSPPLGESRYKATPPRQFDTNRTIPISTLKPVALEPSPIIEYPMPSSYIAENKRQQSRDAGIHEQNPTGIEADTLHLEHPTTETHEASNILNKPKQNKNSFVSSKQDRQYIQDPVFEKRNASWDTQGNVERRSEKSQQMDITHFPSTLNLSIQDACKAVQRHGSYDPQTICCTVASGVWSDPKIWGCGYSPTMKNIAVVLHQVELFDADTVSMNLTLRGLFVLSTRSQQACLKGGLPYWEICKTHLMVYAKQGIKKVKPYRFPWDVFNKSLNLELFDYFRRTVSIQDICMEFLGSFPFRFYPSAEITLASQSFACPKEPFDVINKNINTQTTRNSVHRTSWLNQSECIPGSSPSRPTLESQSGTWSSFPFEIKDQEVMMQQNIFSPPPLIVGEHSALMLFNNITLSILDGGVFENQGTVFLGTNFNASCSKDSPSVTQASKQCVKPSLSIDDNVSLLAIRPIRVASLQVNRFASSDDVKKSFKAPIARWCGHIGYPVWLPHADVSSLIIYQGTQYISAFICPTFFSFKYLYIKGNQFKPIVTSFLVVPYHQTITETMTFNLDVIISEALAVSDTDELEILGDVSLIAESVSVDQMAKDSPEFSSAVNHRVLNVLRLVCTSFCNVNHKIYYAEPKNRVQILADMEHAI